MAPRQLVLRGERRRDAKLDLVANDSGKPPLSFEDPEHGVRVPRLGPAALVEIADRARQHGYTVTRFELAGADARLLADSAEESDVSEVLIEALSVRGKDMVFGLLNHDFRSYLIAGVRLYSDTTRQVTLRRNGVIDGSEDDRLESFVHGVLDEALAG